MCSCIEYTKTLYTYTCMCIQHREAPYLVLIPDYFVCVHTCTHLAREFGAINGGREDVVGRRQAGEKVHTEREALV